MAIRKLRDTLAKRCVAGCAAWAVAAGLMLFGLASHAAKVPVGTLGAVSTAAPAATGAGLEILAAGGNAADAAVAAALALAVVHPQAGNLGGGGFAVVRFGERVTALDFRETAPAAASRDMYLDERGKARPRASLVGPLAAGVPGSPRGLHALHRELGDLPWAEVVAPAIRLARDGFIVRPRLAEDLRERSGLLKRFPESAKVWLPDGRPFEPGTRIQLPELAATLEAYAVRGPRAITTGPVADAVERAVLRRGGVLRVSDLAGYRPVWREPVRFSAFGWQVASMPLPSSGGIILGQTLGLLERLDWPDHPRSGVARLHLLAESWRRSFADRVLLGDPDTSEVGSAELLAGAWLDRRAAQIDLTAATPSKEVSAWSSQGIAESEETTHLSVLDAEGNAVALTTTLNGSFGCGLWIPDAGFFLNNEMDDFATAPGRPNLYGLIQGEANAVGPGKRMLSSMSPTLAWRGDEILVLGSPGGSTIPTVTTQVLLSVIVDGDMLAEAVARPRIHHQWRPDRLFIERGTLASETRKALKGLGHRLWSFDALGEVTAVMRGADGVLQATDDPRHAGSAALATAAQEAADRRLPLRKVRGSH